MNAPPDAAAGAAAAGIGLVMMLFWLVMMAVMVGLMVFWVIAIIDVAKREFPGENDKLMWILVVVLAGWLGALIYWFVGRQKGTRPA